MEDSVSGIQRNVNKNEQNNISNYDVLFYECVKALEPNISILTVNESNSIYKDIQKDLPFTNWGRIDWNTVSTKERIIDISAFWGLIKSKQVFENDIIYILWGCGDNPVIKTNLHSALDAVEDITAVGSDQWLYCPQGRYVIEFYHNGEFTIGFY